MIINARQIGGFYTFFLDQANYYYCMLMQRQSKIEELEVLNVSMRKKDKMKDDVISSLSDRLLTLSERLDVLEKR